MFVLGGGTGPKLILKMEFLKLCRFAYVIEALI